MFSHRFHLGTEHVHCFPSCNSKVYKKTSRDQAEAPSKHVAGTAAAHLEELRIRGVQADPAVLAVSKGIKDGGKHSVTYNCI